MVEFQLFQLLRCRDGRVWWMAAALLPPLALIGGIIWLMNLHVKGPMHLSTVVLPISLVLPLYLLLFFRVSRLLLSWQMDHSLGAGKSHALLGERLVRINEHGVGVEHKSEHIFWRWERILRVVANGDYGYIYTGSDRATIIPRRCFSNGDEAGFRAFMKAAIIYHWQMETATKAALEAAAKEAGDRAEEESQTLQPAPNLTLASTEQSAQRSNSRMQPWSRAGLKNVKAAPDGMAAAETAYIG